MAWDDNPQAVGKDRTDPRRHRTRAIGGPITRYNIKDVELVSVSLVKCCDEVKPGKRCPHGVWGIVKVE